MANTLLEQSIEFQQQRIAELEARQAKLDAESNEIGALWNSARRALNEARNNPATSQETLNQLQQNYDLVSTQRATINDNAQSNSDQLAAVRGALISNQIRAQDPRNNQSFITEQNTTSNPGTNPQINQQAQYAANVASNQIPIGQTATPDSPPAIPTGRFETATADDIAPEPIVDQEPVTGFFYDEDGELIPADSVFEPPRDYNQEISPDSDPAIPTGRFDTATPDDIAGAAQIDSPGLDSTVIPGLNQSTTAARSGAQSSAAQSAANYQQSPDWRFRISLAPGAKYLYNDQQNTLLAPLRSTNGVIFPYTPLVTVSYTSTYDTTDLAHTNYRFYTYRNSAVEAVNISADFTAQDTTQASYMLAMIHFFRSATKMFYGQDQNPIRGTPPPLVYLNGFGNYNFDNHPGVLSSFSYNYPNDVDYISTGQLPISFSSDVVVPKTQPTPAITPSLSRLFGAGLPAGSKSAPARFANRTATQVTRRDNETRVPVKLTINLIVLPIITRQDISNNFSLKKYASGDLMLGSQRGSGGGIW